MLEKDSIRILPFHSSDLEAVIAIENRVYTTPWSQASYEELLMLDSISLWVAKKGEKVVGYMLFQVFPEEAELHTIAVVPEDQSQGIGRMLMERLFKEVTYRGAMRISLQVRVSNDAAIHLYEKFGFRRVGIRKKYYQDNDEDAMVMVVFLQHRIDIKEKFP